ncbi:MAG TPA: hypothetical protein ENF42_01420, partial [Candidatus Bathyarchaeota archaeon]|nr:hypothetical protein [Candidatus Bathyarchaeota archaeon]
MLLNALKWAGTGDLRIEEVVKEEIRLPKLPSNIRELPRTKPKNGKVSRETVLGLVAEMKRHLDHDPFLVEAFVLSMIAGLPTLLVGPHGSGKTTLVKTLASAFYIGKRRIRFKHVTVK